MIKQHPPLPFAPRMPGGKSIIDPDDPTCLEVLADLRQVFGLTTEQVTAEDFRGEDFVKYRRLYCYVANVLSSEPSDRKSSLVNLSSCTYRYHTKKCIKWFELADPQFMILWDIYSSKSELWNKHFKRKSSALRQLH